MSPARQDQAKGFLSSLFSLNITADCSDDDDVIWNMCWIDWHWSVGRGHDLPDLTSETASKIKQEGTEAPKLLLTLGLVVGGELVKEFAVDFHEGLEDVVDESDDRLVPVFLGDAVQTRKHDRQDHSGVLLDQGRHVVIIPVQQSTLCYLKATNLPISESNNRKVFFFAVDSYHWTVHETARQVLRGQQTVSQVRTSWIWWI